MLTPEQKALRSRGVGASEIAAIVGLSPYETALDVYLRKRGLLPSSPDNAYTKWGRTLEAVIADRYAEEYDVELVTSGTVRHPEREWMLATPDRLTADGTRLIEIKNVGANRAFEWGASGTSRIPERYYLQVLWQMAVTGVREADLVALIGGNDLRVYAVEHDAKIEEYMIEVAREFWFDHVVAENPPEVEELDSTARYLSLRYPRDSGESIEATPEIEAWIDRLRELREIGEQVEAAKIEAELAIKEFMGEASTLTSRLGRITYKSTKDIQTVDWRGAARAAQVPADVIAEHTTTKPGPRRFLPKLGEN